MRSEMENETSPSEATRAAERADAGEPAAADRAPTSEEEAEAERSRATFADDAEKVAEHYQDMNDVGANVKGEGSVE
jgi:hypothetical protein